MNFMKEDRGYYNGEHEENAVEEMRETASNFLFPSSSSSATSKYEDYVPRQHRNLWSGTLDSREDYRTQEPAIDLDKKLGLVDLSLGNNNEYPSNVGSCIGGDSSRSTEKEHMFDKVVTPSDVGKLNRLVIPKQHAEKYFPLNGSSNEKGLILNFEDPIGKSWRFRYSYWNSSQSYVMTKGWSRFVKEKKLNAGDTVSFHRGVGEAGKDRLYIDWKRRPNAPDPATLAHMQLQSRFSFPQSVRWGSLYSMPQTMCVSRSYEPLHRLNYSIYPYSHRHHQQQQRQATTYGNVGQYYPRSSSGSHHQTGEAFQGEPMVIDSVPVVQGTKTVFMTSAWFSRFRDLLLAILISSYFKILLTAMMVWEFPPAVIYIIDLFVFSSNTVALKVITKSTMNRCIGACFVAHAVKFCITQVFS